ncbi:MAG: hypothetical protein WEH44_01835, partial [Pirellulaceae bacterium]
MRIAVLGADSDSLALVEAAVELGHEITWLGDVRAVDADAIQSIVPDADVREDWEALLDRGFIDAVIVGRGSAELDQRLEQLKRLAAEAAPMVVVFPLGTEILPYYELDMLRREHRTPLVHYHPLRFAPFVGELNHIVRDGHAALGTIHQIQSDRRLADTSRDAVLTWLARDMDLVRQIVGDIAKLSAMGPNVGGTQYAALQVQMSGPAETAVHWRVAPTAAAGGLQVTLVGERGQLALDVPDASERVVTWTLTVVAGSSPAASSTESADAAAAAVQELEQGVQSADGGGSWDAAMQAMEMVDAVELSLQKGRTIEVHHQVLTEHVAFKGMMSAFGCGLLVFGFLLLLAVGALGDLLGFTMFKYWPVVALVLLAFFLLLQVVP